MDIAKPLRVQAYEHIKSLVDGEKLEYGVIYSETRMALEIGVSRTPMRDAIHRLAQEEYIDIIPSKGFMLREMSGRDIEDTYQVRCAIECFCTMLIAKEASTKKARKLLKNLERVLENQKKIILNSHSVDDFYEHDQLFHYAIIEYCGNQVFTQLFNSYIYKIKRIAISTLKTPNRMEETLNEHFSIYSAMNAGSIHDVYKATLKHMEAPKSIKLPAP